MTPRTRLSYARPIGTMAVLALAAGMLVAGSASATPTRDESPMAPAASDLTITLTAADTAEAGATYSASIDWRDSAGDLIATVSSWGDTGIGWSTPPSCDDDSVTAGPSSGTETFEHAWSEPGTYTVDLSVTTGGCGVADDTQSVTFTVVVSS